MNKKNILYIGPYKQNNYLGVSSLRNLYELIKNPKYNTIYRHITVDDDCTLFDVSTIVPDIEIPDSINNLDAIVQNLPIDLLDSNRYTKNVYIPFFSSFTSHSYDSVFDENNFILIDNFYAKDDISHKNVKIYSTDTPIIINNAHQEKYNIGIYNNLYKFGFIGSYSTDYLVIQKLLQSFLLSFRSNDDVCFCLLLTANDNQKNELESYYRSLLKDMSVNNYDKIIFMYTDAFHIDSIRLINNISCYISMNYNTDYTLYNNYAKKIGISTICPKDLTYIKMPLSKISNSKHIDTIQKSFITQNMSALMKERISGKSQYSSKNKQESLSSVLDQII